MIAAAQVTKAIEAFDHHGQQAEQPTDQHAVGVMMTDMFQAVAVLASLKALVFNLPTALRLSEILIDAKSPTSRRAH
jgi:hypothetical protein